MSQRLQERFGSIGARNPIARRQCKLVLGYLHTSRAHRLVNQESNSDDRVVDATVSDPGLDPPTPHERVSLEQVE
jgi:hypothetical protein